jgi:Domain of unknown function (DUF4337)
MAELEIHQEHEGNDPAGKKVGVLAAVLAVFLAVVTIESHRAHTEGILLKTDANDQWNFYQAERLKLHNLEVGEELLSLLGVKGDEAIGKALRKYQSDIGKYDEKSKELIAEAQEKEKEATHAEHQALRFDFGEGLLEIGLVLSSLYFISRRMMFPVMGIIAGLAGIAIAAAGLVVQ